MTNHGAEATFTRIAASLFDLHEARQYLERLLPAENAVKGSLDDILQNALTTALCVAYSRPFSRNRCDAGMAGRLPNDVFNSLTPGQRRLHRRVVQRRNQEFAHSDPSALAPSVEDDPRSANPVPWVPATKQAFSEDDLRELQAVLDTMMKALEVLFHKLGKVVRQRKRQ